MKNHIFMFERQFVPRILSGAKRQTIRLLRKRMPHPGDTLEARFWSGAAYRTKQIYIGTAKIEDTIPIRIFPETGGIFGRENLPNPETLYLDDGFLSWFDFFAFFRQKYTKKEPHKDITGISAFVTYFNPNWDILPFSTGYYKVENNIVHPPL
jgi:hypothetical protein